jgi:cell division protein ZapA (FtsZ GTPase activity inhibitor)
MNQHQIEILGQKFLIKTDATREQVEEVSALVKKVSDDIHAKSPHLATGQVAILTALNIAEQSLKEKKRLTDAIEDWRKRLVRWVQKVGRGGL